MIQRKGVRVGSSEPAGESTVLDGDTGGGRRCKELGEGGAWESLGIKQCKGHW